MLLWAVSHQLDAVRFISLCSQFVQFSSVLQLCLSLCNATDSNMPGVPMHHSQRFLKLMSIDLVMLSNHLILCLPLLLLHSVFPNIRVFSNDSACLVCSQSLLKSTNMYSITLCPHCTPNSRQETKNCRDWRLIPAHRCGDIVPTYFLENKIRC